MQENTPQHQYIAVIDFGSQFAHLIARRIRQHNVLAKIFTPDQPASMYADAKGVILSGGPKSTIGEDAIEYDAGVFELGVPVLGLCYGHQLIAQHFGGSVEKGKTKEYGQADVEISNFDDVFKGLEPKERVWMSHWDVVAQEPAGFEVIGSTPDCRVAAMRNTEKRIWSFQYHLEVHHTVHGMQMLENFLNICQVRADWNIEAIEEEIIAEVQAQVNGYGDGNKKVFLLVSGGVDSTVAFALLEKALGKGRVYGLHVDNGFMRLNESEKVGNALAEAGFSNLHTIDASDRFVAAVAGVVDPEEKRNIIGRLFVEIANEEMAKLDLDQYLLGQGTIYPDTIESGGTKHADKIKTHHNRVDLIQELMAQGKVVEPLHTLYKDEVREIGKRLGISAPLLERQPFPGPGISIRTLCSDGDATIQNEAELNQQLAAVAAAMNMNVTVRVLPVKSVGVQGDERSYKHPAVVIGEATWEELNELSVRITNEVFDINRVLWLVDGPAGTTTMSETATIHKADINHARLNTLRAADDAAMQTMFAHNLQNVIWQFPVVLLPFGDTSTSESLVLRPIESQEAMTVNFYPMDRTVLAEMVAAMRAANVAETTLDYIFFDITNKPPATIEWE